MDNHPTIDITQTPLLDCPNPVYDCIEYCLQANDYIQQAGAPAAFAIAFQPDNYPDGVVISVGGRPFETATPGGVGSFSWQGSVADITQNFVDMLNRDYYFGCNFAVVVTFGFAFAVALDVGEVPNWGFFFPVANPPTVADTPGADVVVRDNYRLIVEVWRCELGAFFSTGQVRTEKITTRSFEPDPETGEVCFDIQKIVRSLVQTTFPGLTVSPVIEDTTIKDLVCLRFGELYSDGSTECDATTQWFEDTTAIEVINSVFQKDDEEGILPFCLDVATNPAPRFLTNRPNFAQICTESFAWLWYLYDQDAADFINGSGGLLQLEQEAVFNYTDGSSDTVTVEVIVNPGGSVLIVPSGLAQIGSLADPAKEIDNYTITVGVRVTGFAAIIPLSETLTYDIPGGNFCCCHEEFYFLGEPGGYDTIMFNCLRETDLSYSSTEFCAFEPCGGDILEGGKQEAETKSFEIFRTTTRFLDNYENISWFREFLHSPKRYWRREGKVYKIVLLNNEVELRRKDEFLYVTLEYILSFDLKTHKN